MMAVSSPLSSRQTVTALLTLTAVTGLVDAVSYLRLGRVYVANMQGDQARLEHYIEHDDRSLSSPA